MTYYYSTLFLFIFSLNIVKADHIVGGELQLTHNTGDQYTIALNFYFNDLTGEPSAKDNSIYISIFKKKDNSLVTIQLLPVVSDVFIPNIGGNCSNANVSTRLIRYVSQITLSSSVYNDQEGYYMTWERCCRNHTITNIQNPAVTGEVFYLEFPPVINNGNSMINSSPVYRKLKNIFGCKGKPFYFDFGADDADGDSLVYSLNTPLKGHSSDVQGNLAPVGLSAPYDSIIWENTYNLSNEIQGNPSLNIDRNSGKLYVTSSDTGLFVFAVDCEEFRNGKKIGEVRREFQIRIDSCPPLFAPQINLQKPDHTSYKEGDTLTINMNSPVCYSLSVTDSTWDSLHVAEFISLAGSGLSEPNISLSIDSSSFEINTGNDTGRTKLCISVLCINGQYNYAGYYSYSIIASDNSCPEPLTDTLNLMFYIIPDTNKVPHIYPLPKSRSVNLYVGDSYTLNIYGTDKNSSDFLHLYAVGKEFNIQDAGMMFNNVSGKDSLSSIFSWRPICDNFKSSQNFQVFFIIKDDHCINPESDTLEINFTLSDHYYPFDFNPANLFTPNKDGLNESFEIPDLPKDYCENYFVKIEIYNIWGSKVFESLDRDFKWIPEKESDGMYYYAVKYSNAVYKSWVQIIK